MDSLRAQLRWKWNDKTSRYDRRQNSASNISSVIGIIKTEQTRKVENKKKTHRNINNSNNKRGTKKNYKQNKKATTKKNKKFRKKQEEKSSFFQSGRTQKVHSWSLTFASLPDLSETNSANPNVIHLNTNSTFENHLMHSNSRSTSTGLRRSTFSRRAVPGCCNDDFSLIVVGFVVNLQSRTLTEVGSQRFQVSSRMIQSIQPSTPGFIFIIIQTFEADGLSKVLFNIFNGSI